MSTYRRRVTLLVTLAVPRDVTAAEAPAYVKAVLLNSNLVALSPTVEMATNTGVELTEHPTPSRAELDATTPKQRALPSALRKLPPLKK